MLEVIAKEEKCPISFEKDENDLIFSADKLPWFELENLVIAYHSEHCLFKTKIGQKIEIISSTRKHLEVCHNLINKSTKCSCGKNPCHSLLSALSEIFDTKFFTATEGDMYCIIQAEKIYPILLGCLHASIADKSKGEMKLYFTTSQATSLLTRGIYEETTTAN
jgi:hypothetical protein